MAAIFLLAPPIPQLGKSGNKKVLFLSNEGTWFIFCDRTIEGTILERPSKRRSIAHFVVVLVDQDPLI